MRGRDVGATLSDRRPSHFNRHRDEAWPWLTGVLSRRHRHDVAIVVTTSTESLEEMPHQKKEVKHTAENKKTLYAFWVFFAFYKQRLTWSSTSINQYDNLTKKGCKQQWMELTAHQSHPACLGAGFLEALQVCLLWKWGSVHKAGLEFNLQEIFSEPQKEGIKILFPGTKPRLFFRYVTAHCKFLKSQC